MARYGQGYSRAVSWAKIVLPMAAIAILSSLFLFSKSYDPSQNVLLGNKDVAEFAATERITAPRFAGMTPGGVTIQIAAREGKPRAEGGPAFDAVDLNAHIEAPDGTVIDLKAKSGAVDSLAQQAELSNGITIASSHGFVAETFGMTFALDRLHILSQGAVTAKGPLGNLNAGGMEYGSATDQGDTSLLVFNGGVKLVYTP